MHWRNDGIFICIASFGQQQMRNALIPNLHCDILLPAVSYFEHIQLLVFRKRTRDDILQPAYQSYAEEASGRLKLATLPGGKENATRGVAALPTARASPARTNVLKHECSILLTEGVEVLIPDRTILLLASHTVIDYLILSIRANLQSAHAFWFYDQ